MFDTAIERIVNRPPVTVDPEASLVEAARRMLEGGVGSLLVVDAKGMLTGIVTDGDFTAREVGIPFSTFRAPKVLGEWLGSEGVEEVYRQARRRTVAEVMSSPVHFVEEDCGLADVLHLMMARRVKHVPVVDEGRPIGMIARHDLLKLLVDDPRDEEA